MSKRDKRGHSGSARGPTRIIRIPRSVGRVEADPPARGVRSSSAVRSPRDVQPTAKHPSPIELLELDIDIRIADLWAEMVEVDEWSVDVVVALMRAAYGNGYCDALTEEEPGALCRDHSDVAPVP